MPGLSEPEAVRHYVRLSRMNYGIDCGVFPLGSCTMKHNPRLNEKMARLPGFADVHPLQPQSTVPGALELIDEFRGLAARTHRHAGGRADAESRRAWRALRHDGDQGGAHRSRREAFRRAGAGVGAWHQSGDCRAARLSSRVRAGARGRHGRPRGGEETSLGRCRRHHAHQSEHLRAVRARCGGDCRGGARGRRVLLCGWRELQRHRRQGAARRPRRRRHAHQPAQDLLDAAWRRRTGRGAGGAFRGARALRAASVLGAR